MCNANAINVHRINEISHATDLVAVLLCARRQQLASQFSPRQNIQRIWTRRKWFLSKHLARALPRLCVHTDAWIFSEKPTIEVKVKSHRVVRVVRHHRRLIMIGTLTLNCQMPSSHAASILNGMSNEHCLRSASAYVLSEVEFWARLKAEKTYDVSINLARCVPIVFRVRCENRQCVSDEWKKKRTTRQFHFKRQHCHA